jgi:alpha-beta hydrolase superfamily lysophospholipase
MTGEPSGAPTSGAAAPSVAQGPAGPLERPIRPAPSYADALAGVRELQAQDAGADINPISRTRLFLPGGEVGPRVGGGADPDAGPRAARVYLCFHGLTNSPQQYVPLAQRLLARGDAAVFIPRIPRHGFADRMTTELAQLTEAELVDATAEAVDLAAGLADEVVVTGLSMGGVLAAWVAQYRPVARVVVVAPAIGLPFLPPFTAAPLAALTLRLGNRFFWWDPRSKAEAPGPTYAYPRYATHALARVQRLGLRLIDVARTTPPAARSVWMVTNGADVAVSNGLANRLADNWRRSGGADVHQYEFPRRLHLFHDIVDPEQPYQQVKITHPALERLLADGEPPDIPAEATAAGAAPA